MSKADKLLKRFLSSPKDFSYDELVRLLAVFGYEEVAPGKTAGSRRAFINSKTKSIIRMHKPHPSNILKRYQVADAMAELRSKGVTE